MTGKTTFRDILNECELFKHSKEYFNLMKENTELSLLEKYIDDQEFILSTDFDPVVSSLKESGFFESASDETIKQYIEAAEAKKKNIFQKIWEGFLKFIKILGRFFKTIAEGIKKAFTKDTYEDLLKDDIELLDSSDVEVLDGKLIEKDGAKTESVAEFKEKIKGIRITLLNELVQIYQHSIYGKEGGLDLPIKPTANTYAKAGFVPKNIGANKNSIKSLVIAVNQMLSIQIIWCCYGKESVYSNAASAYDAAGLVEQLQKLTDTIKTGPEDNYPRYTRDVESQIIAIKARMQRSEQMSGFSIVGGQNKSYEEKVSELCNGFCNVLHESGCVDTIVTNAPVAYRSETVEIYSELPRIVSNTITVYTGALNFWNTIKGWVNKYKAAISNGKIA